MSILSLHPRVLIIPLFLVAGLSIGLSASPQDLQQQAEKKISVLDAAKHIGETMWVCGDVASTRYDRTEIGMPTFLLFGQG